MPYQAFIDNDLIGTPIGPHWEFRETAESDARLYAMKHPGVRTFVRHLQPGVYVLGMNGETGYEESMPKRGRQA